MANTSVAFRYKPMLGHRSPVATLGLCLNDAWHKADFYVDSGATYSILHGNFARAAGFEYAKGQRLLIKVGDGSLIPVFMHRVPVQIGPYRLDVRMGFSDNLGVGFHLLGRLDVFDHFRVCFHEPQHAVIFEPFKL